MDRIVIIENSDSERLTFELIEYESNEPEKGDYFKLQVKAESDGFSGWSQFWVKKKAMDRFIYELEQFDRSLRGNPKIECMIGDDLFFSMKLFPYDTLGHLGCRIELAAQISSNNKREVLHRFIGELNLEPTQIAKITEGLRRVSTVP